MSESTLKSPLPESPRSAPLRWLRLLRLLRVHHWTKNALLAVPYLTAQAWRRDDVLLPLLVGFLSLSVIASATYVFNDMADLAHDRAHASKKSRPLASGEIGLPAAMVVAVALLVAGGLGALAIGGGFLRAMALYVVTTTAYTRYFKRVALLDVLVLAALWVLRLIAGAAAIQVELSVWLLTFAGFLFLSLSLAKRAAELTAYHGPAERLLPGRGYQQRDLPAILGFGIATGMVSILVLALFVDSTSAMHAYPQHSRLWLLCLPMWFWQARLWLVTARGEMHHDPVSYSLRDRSSWVSLLVVAGVWLSALSPW